MVAAWLIAVTTRVSPRAGAWQGPGSRRNRTGRSHEEAAPYCLLHLPELRAAPRPSGSGAERRMEFWECESECRHRPSGRRWGDLQRLASGRCRPAHAW
ncbi:hypothetical protein NN561_017463 [Cricetulus griseus]